MKFDRRLILNFDWVLLFLALGICVLGILNIYSAGFSLTDPRLKFLYLKQLAWIGIGLFFMAMAFLIDYRSITRHAYIIYIISLIMLALVFIIGYSTRGSQRWIGLGFFSFQPSELMKLSMILALAKYFDDHKAARGYLLREMILPLP